MKKNFVIIASILAAVCLMACLIGCSDSGQIYTITYDLAGGALPEGKTNPTVYTSGTETFTLINPVMTGFNFTGWKSG